MPTQKLEDMTFDELASYASIRIHEALLENGGKGFKNAVFVWLNQAIIWSNENR